MMDFIKTHRIHENLYLLEEEVAPGATVTMMLVIGAEKAAIIDSGYGFSDSLLRHLRFLTEKPFICLLTHGDPDHAGGCALFNEIYLNPLDNKDLKGALMPFVRLKILENLCSGDKAVMAAAKKQLIRQKPVIRPLAHGDIFDLGGCKLEAFALGGHSAGSMCFINRKEHYAFTGDSIANLHSSVLMFDRCLPLSVYQHNLKRFLLAGGDKMTLYSGHDLKPLDPNLITEILTLCDEVLAGHTQEDEPYLPPFFKVPQGITGFRRLWAEVLMSLMIKAQQGGAKPLEHKKSGFTASVKYNARKVAAS